MAQAEESGNRARQQFGSIRMNNCSADLLQRLVSRNHFPGKFQEPSEEAEEIELSLGLSLNGRFGIDPRAKSDKLGLKRSSSIADFTSNPIKDEATSSPAPATGYFSPLARTCSLPTETEEQWRKRKELQSLRRMEAKRKRSEKQRNMKAVRDRSRAASVEECGDDDKRGVNGSTHQLELEFSSMAMPAWIGGAKASCGNEVNGVDRGAEGLPPQPASQGSIGSQRSGSSGITESDCQAGQPQGAQKSPEARSPASVHSLPESEQKLSAPRRMISLQKSGEFGAMVIENQAKKPDLYKNGSREIARNNVLEDMPCVSATGDGPDGKKIEGFLYRYRKGEEVRIVCVCHGNFLSPAEFVKHAGGGDVAHPLKHIVVNPSSFL
ncbi:hypothetical protein UlMin_014598 [Ulmus minor]